MSPQSSPDAKADAKADADAAEPASAPSRRRGFGVRPSLVIAVLLAVAAGGWILTGEIEGQAPPASASAPADAAEDAEAADFGSPANRPAGQPVAVRVFDSVAEPRRAFLQMTGRTVADRRALLSAETTGRIVEVAVELGDRVAEGDLVVRLAEDDRMAQLREAQALVKQRQIEFNAADQLSKKGFQSETNRAQALAQLEAAQAQLERIRVELDKTRLAAPFDGVVEAQMVEVGDFAQPGVGLIRLVDLDPMLVQIQVSEREIDRIEMGGEAEIRLVSGQRTTGRVSRIAPTASDATRTFEVEIQIDNPDGALRDGVTTEVRLPTQEVMAHRLSPAVLTLDDIGRVGVKAVDADDRVVFHPVDILEDRSDGMWVTGLPMTLTIIRVGQEYVAEGARVRPTSGDAFEDAPEPKIDTDPIDRDAPPRVSRTDADEDAMQEQAQ